jgi:hypothetical protein
MYRLILNYLMTRQLLIDPRIPNFLMFLKNLIDLFYPQ